jgi:thiol-disulfide isomerase/thioredoxin
MGATIIDKKHRITLLESIFAAAGLTIGLWIATSRADNASNSVPNTATHPEPKNSVSLAASREQIIALRKEVNETEDFSNRTDRRPGATDAEVGKSLEAYSKVFDTDLPKIVKAVAQDPTSSNSFDTLIWITSNKRMLRNQIPTGAELEVIQLLGQFHATNAGVGQLCSKIGRLWDWHWKDQQLFYFLNAVLDKNPNRITRGQAVFSLARLNRAKAQYLIDWENELDPTPGDAAKQKARAEYFQIAKKEDSKMAFRETERLLNEVIKNYGDCPYIRAIASRRPATTLSEEARHNLYEILHLTIGETAPDLKGDDIDGKPIKLSDYRGKVVVLSFWASWCGPCMAMVPHERELTDRMRGKPFALIGVNGDDKKADARRAVDKEKITWPSFWNGAEGPHGPIPTEWNVNNWPTVFILDAKGKIRLKLEGLNNKRLDDTVDRLLAEATNNP